MLGFLRPTRWSSCARLPGLLVLGRGDACSHWECESPFTESLIKHLVTLDETLTPGGDSLLLFPWRREKMASQKECNQYPAAQIAAYLPDLRPFCRQRWEAATRKVSCGLGLLG